MITAPSPPGRWKARRPARARQRAITPTATSRIDASTKPHAWKALSESSSSTVLPFGRAMIPFCWYHGRSIERTMATEVATASRCSGKRSFQSAHQRAERELTP